MPVLVDYVNDSLSMVGETSIASLDDGTTKANICAAHVATTLRAILSMTKWNFAYTRESLAGDAITPVSGWAYKYTPPGNYVRIWGINDDGSLEGRPDPRALWKVERDPADGNVKIFTNEVSPIILHYTPYLEDASRWDGMFGFAFVTLLASRLAGSFKTDKLAMQYLEMFHKVDLPNALASDAVEGNTGEVIISDGLLRVRDG